MYRVTIPQIKQHNNIHVVRGNKTTTVVSYGTEKKKYMDEGYISENVWSNTV